MKHVRFIDLFVMRPVHIFHNLASMVKHVVPYGFPESPARLIAVTEALESSGIWSLCKPQEVGQISEDVFIKQYGKEEVTRWKELVEHAKLADDVVDDDMCGDIFWSSGSLEAIATAANAAVTATKTVLMADGVEHAFCVLRPPGHHCFQTPSGFCTVNNVVLAAQVALDMGKRVAIIDWDYHFGNGTADTFLENSNVMFCSLHCAKDRHKQTTYPSHPLKGDLLAVKTNGRMFNIQWLKDDADDAAYAYAFDTAILPAIRLFAPDIILVSAGYDSLKGDDLAGMELTAPVFREITKALTCLNIPTVCVMEGGYNTDLLASGVLETVRGLLGGGVDGLAILGALAQEHHKAVVDACLEK